MAVKAKTTKGGSYKASAQKAKASVRKQATEEPAEPVNKEQDEEVHWPGIEGFVFIFEKDVIDIVHHTKIECAVANGAYSDFYIWKDGKIKMIASCKHLGFYTDWLKALGFVKPDKKIVFNPFHVTQLVKDYGLRFEGFENTGSKLITQEGYKRLLRLIYKRTNAHD